MKQLDILKKNIVESEQAMEAAGVLDGSGSVLHGKEVIWENGRLQEITVYGKRSLKKRLH